jgi:hypothetical protein
MQDIHDDQFEPTEEEEAIAVIRDNSSGHSSYERAIEEEEESFFLIIAVQGRKQPRHGAFVRVQPCSACPAHVSKPCVCH